MYIYKIEGLIFGKQGYFGQVRVLDEKSAECAECMQTTTTKQLLCVRHMSRSDLASEAC